MKFSVNGAIVFFLLILSATPVPSGPRLIAVQTRSTSALWEPVAVPDQLQYSAEFVRFLEGAGLVVQSVHRSHLEAMFRDVTKAVFVETDKGVVEAVFFPEPDDAEKITITYSRTSGERVLHRYRFQRPSIKDAGAGADAAYPVYFTLHKNWFIQMLEPELDGLLKRALGQTKRSAR